MSITNLTFFFPSSASPLFVSSQGMDDYISKPVDQQRLQEVLDKWRRKETEKRWNSVSSVTSSSYGMIYIMLYHAITPKLKILVSYTSRKYTCHNLNERMACPCLYLHTSIQHHVFFNLKSQFSPSNGIRIHSHGKLEGLLHTVKRMWQVCKCTLQLGVSNFIAAVAILDCRMRLVTSLSWGGVIGKDWKGFWASGFRYLYAH